MAVKDVRAYYAQCITQKIGIEKTFSEFEDAVKKGYISEDRLESIKKEYARMQENIDRLAYILYLLEIPVRKEKKAKFKKATKDIETGFTRLNASEAAILDENTSVLKYIREELKKLTEKADK